ATELRNGANGRLDFTATVCGLTIVLLSYGPRAENAIWDFSSGSTMRSKVNLTASAVNGVPSWNLTSLRRWKVYRSALGLTSHRSASPGTNSPAFASQSKGSKRWNPMRATSVNVVMFGSSV